MQLWASNGIVGFGNEAWSEDLIMSPTQATEAYFFQIYTSPTQATEAYLRPLLSFSSVIATFEKFRYQKFGVERYAHAQFRS